MSPTIRIPDDIYKRLQKLAKPFVDTPAAIIERLLDFNDNYYKMEMKPSSDDTGISVRKLDPNSPEDLSHTRILKAHFGSANVDRPGWNNLVKVAHIVAKNEGKSFSELSQLTRANIVKGERSDRGFHYVEEIDISIQGENSNKSWKISFDLAKELDIPIEVKFEWLNLIKAAHPGKKGILLWGN
ncbi:MAG: hypothetical protein IIC40_01195 [Candidatus Marinimicrobia bacterium]|nr:hypothetical protein [Candidatus Neomarinimicrobiota bacterium]